MLLTRICVKVNKDYHTRVPPELNLWWALACVVINESGTLLEVKRSKENWKGTTLEKLLLVKPDHPERIPDLISLVNGTQLRMIVEGRHSKCYFCCMTSFTSVLSQKKQEKCLPLISHCYDNSIIYRGKEELCFLVLVGDWNTFLDANLDMVGIVYRRKKCKSLTNLLSCFQLVDRY